MHVPHGVVVWVRTVCVCVSLSVAVSLSSRYHTLLVCSRCVSTGHGVCGVRLLATAWRGEEHQCGAPPHLDMEHS